MKLKHEKSRSGQADEQHDTRHGHRRDDIITAADLLAGATMPIRLRLNVTIRPGSDSEGEQRRGAHHRRGQDVGNSLRRHTAQLLKWAQRSTTNATQLLIDPVAAVDRARLDVSPADRRALKQSAESLSAADVLPPGFELVALTIAAASEPRQRAPTEPPKDRSGSDRKTSKQRRRQR